MNIYQFSTAADPWSFGEIPQTPTFSTPGIKITANQPIIQYIIIHLLHLFIEFVPSGKSQYADIILIIICVSFAFTV